MVVDFSHRKEIVRVLVVDDDYVVRKTLAFALKSLTNNIVIMECDSTRLFDRKCGKLMPHVTFVNLHLQNDDADRVIRSLRQQFPRTYLLGLSIARHNTLLNSPVINMDVDALIQQEHSLQDIWQFVQHGLAIYAR